MSAQPQSLARFKANLQAVLLADTALTTFATENLGGVLKPMDGNVAIGKILPQEMPCLGFEVGDGKNQGLTIGNSQQSVQGEIKLFVVFVDQERESAFQKRLQLPDLFINALMRNPTLNLNDGTGDGTDGAWVQDWTSNRGNPAQHPRHWMQFTVTGIYRDET